MAQSFAGSSATTVNDKIALLARLLNNEQQACRLLGDYEGSLSTLVLKAAASTAAYNDNPGLETIGAARDVVQAALCEELVQRTVLNAPQYVRDYLRLKLGGREHEVFMVLFLDAQNQLIAAEEMFRGTLNQTSVFPREIVKAAMSYNCAAVIFAHNHPSGLDTPSQADLILTEKLRQALALVDVRVLDHFIVCTGSGPVLSFAERGLV